MMGKGKCPLCGREVVWGGADESPADACDCRTGCREPDGETEHGDRVYLHKSETKKYRLRCIQYLSGESREHGIELSSVAMLKDWIIITYPEDKLSPAARQHTRKHLEKIWGGKVLLIPDFFEFFVFEEVEEEDGGAERHGGSSEDGSGDREATGRDRPERMGERVRGEHRGSAERPALAEREADGDPGEAVRPYVDENGYHWP